MAGKNATADTDFSYNDDIDPDAALPMTEGGDDDDVLDLSAVDENATFAVAPAGIYDAVLKDAEWGVSQAGNKMITWTFEFENPDTNRKQRAWQYSVLNDDNMPRLKRLIKRLDPNFDVSQFRPKSSPPEFIGAECRLRIGVQAAKGDNPARNNIRDILPANEGSSSFLDN